MRWVKQGLVFEPQRQALPHGCTEFAQSPQALVFDDFVRIYFSTRSRDAAGQYLSQIAFVEVDRDLRRILRTSTDTVIPLGALGCFDEHGIFPINIVRHAGRVYAYTCGWSRRVAVPVETAIGLAVSADDGVTFQRVGAGPVMAPSLDEPFLVGDPFVVVRGGVWHMWYSFGSSWTEAGASEKGPARVYKIAHAHSVDGVAWQRDARMIIADTLGPDECQALPTVIAIDGRWHMYFCYREATDFRANRHRGYRLGYAVSDDLHQWRRDDARGGLEVSAEGWDSDMLCYPHVFWCGDRACMLYNGNEFGRAGFGVAVLEG